MLAWWVCVWSVIILKYVNKIYIAIIQNNTEVNEIEVCASWNNSIKVENIHVVITYVAFVEIAMGKMNYWRKTLINSYFRDFKHTAHIFVDVEHPFDSPSIQISLPQRYRIANTPISQGLAIPVPFLLSSLTHPLLPYMSFPMFNWNCN